MGGFQVELLSLRLDLPLLLPRPVHERLEARVTTQLGQKRIDFVDKVMVDETDLDRACLPVQRLIVVSDVRASRCRHPRHLLVDRDSLTRGWFSEHS